MPAPINPNQYAHNVASGNVQQGNIHPLLQWLFGQAGLLGAGKQVAQPFENAVQHPGARSALQAIAMLPIGGGRGGDFSPLDNASWMENYSLPKAQASGHLAFKEGQPYDVRGALSEAKTTALLNRVRAFTDPGRTPGNAIPARQFLYDILFGGEVHVTPGHSIPPRL